MSTLRVALFTPYFHTERGNSITARRLVDGLRQRGLHVDVVPYAEAGGPPHHWRDTWAAADIVHGLHAYHFGLLLHEAIGQTQPVVITMTGTDLNVDLYIPGRQEVVRQAVRRAHHITVYHAAARAELESAVPGTYGKTSIIPHSVHLDRAPFPLRERLGLNEADFVFLLLAGLRPVKQVHLAVDWFAAVHARHPHAHLVVAGPVLEESYGHPLLEQMAHSPGVHYLGEVPHRMVWGVLQESDAALNSSRSEGMPQSILEAMSLGKPVLVSHNTGNRATVTDGQNGLIYRDRAEFVAACERLLHDGELRRRLGAQARRHIVLHHSEAGEMSAHVNIYRHLAASAARASSQY